MYDAGEDYFTLRVREANLPSPVIARLQGWEIDKTSTITLNGEKTVLSRVPKDSKVVSVEVVKGWVKRLDFKTGD